MAKPYFYIVENPEDGRSSPLSETKRNPDHAWVKNYRYSRELQPQHDPSFSSYLWNSRTDLQKFRYINREGDEGKYLARGMAIAKRFDKDTEKFIYPYDMPLGMLEEILSELLEIVWWTITKTRAQIRKAGGDGRIREESVDAFLDDNTIRVVRIRAQELISHIRKRIIHERARLFRESRKDMGSLNEVMIRRRNAGLSEIPTDVKKEIVKFTRGLNYNFGKNKFKRMVLK